MLWDRFLSNFLRMRVAAEPLTYWSDLQILPQILVPTTIGNQMPQFITRVEMHGADAEHYAKLHAAMRDHGFSRKIISDDGTIYKLPTAEYNRNGENLSIQGVYEEAWRVAKSISETPAVLVIETAGRIIWNGLEPL